MICDKKSCTGCSACFNICKRKAITMEKDEFGNIYPSVDIDKCIKCGLCKKVCPQINDKNYFNKTISAFAMYNKDQKKRQESSSGGAATSFYELILRKNGIIYGVSNLFGDDEFKFVRIDNKNELYKVKGSKYLHAYVKNIFQQVKDDLLNNKYVLFIGTPCQVAGLKGYLLKDYENLITIDIICHGVPSQQLFFDELNNLNITKKDVNIVSFRDNSGFNMKIYSQNGKLLFEKKSNDIFYYKNFLEGNIYRENCYDCKYARNERVSDVTIGDFWGLSDNCKIKDSEEKGISLVLVNSETGMSLVNEIRKEIFIEERPISEAYFGNEQLNYPSKKNNKYFKYIKLYPNKGYIFTMNHMMNLKEKVKFFIKKIVHKK